MRVLVLDTGPLCHYVKARYGRDLPGPMPSSTPFRTRWELDAFEGFVRGHNKRLTVPGIAVELWGLFRSDEARAAVLWKLFVSQMKELQIEERHILPIDIDVDAAALDGPVDVALCALARNERFDHPDVTILTIEQRHVSKWRDRSKSKVITLLQVLDQLRSAR